jgi:excisionase family DNA binding protein
VELLIGEFILPILYCSLIGMPIDPTPEGEFLTTAEVAKLLKISVSSVRRLQSARVIPFVKVGGSVRFTKRDIASYLTRNRVMPIGS